MICRQVATKTKLIRFVRQRARPRNREILAPASERQESLLGEDKVALDLDQTLSGRGCYCHPQCLLEQVAGEKVLLSLFAIKAKEMTNATRRGWLREVLEKLSIQQLLLQRKADVESLAIRLREKDSQKKKIRWQRTEPQGQKTQGQKTTPQPDGELEDTIRSTLLVISRFEEKVSQGEKGQKKLRLRL